MYAQTKQSTESFVYAKPDKNRHIGLTLDGCEQFYW